MGVGVVIGSTALIPNVAYSYFSIINSAEIENLERKEEKIEKKEVLISDHNPLSSVLTLNLK